MDEDALVFEYSRSPAAFREALLTSELLRDCREALAAHGFSPELASGAKIFVSPEQYEAVVRACEDLDLRPRHVVVSHELFESVGEVVRGLPSSKKVRETGVSTVVFRRV